MPFTGSWRRKSHDSTGDPLMKSQKIIISAGRNKKKVIVLSKLANFFSRLSLFVR
jgi:hypothetical protein